MTKQSPTTSGFTPGDSYRREDNVLMVEVKPGVYCNETTALTRHNVVPRKREKGGHHGPMQGS